MSGAPEQPAREAGRGEALAGAITFAGQRGAAEALAPPNFEDTRLPAECVESLQPVLDRLGWRAEPAEVQSAIGIRVKTFSFTLLRNDASTRALLWLTGDALRVMRDDDLTEATWLRLVQLRDALRGAYPKLYFVHHRDFHLAYRNKMRGEWTLPSAGVVPAFVVQQDMRQVADLPAPSQDGELRAWFDLDAAPPSASTPKRPAKDIPLSDLRALARQMSRLGRWQDSDAERRRIFLTSAGVDAAGLHLEASAEEAAQDVVFSTYDGPLGEQLLRCIVEEGDLSGEGRALVERLLADYRFEGNGHPPPAPHVLPTPPAPSPGPPAPGWIQSPVFGPNGGKGTLTALKSAYTDAALLRQVATLAQLDVTLVNFDQAVGFIPEELLRRAHAEGRLVELLAEFLGDASSRGAHARIWSQLSEDGAQRVHAAAMRSSPDFSRAAILPEAAEYQVNADQASLQRVVNVLARFNDPADFRYELAQREARVLQVLVDGRGMGTAWLVAPDLVLTAYHVVAPAQGVWGRVKLLLDHKVLRDDAGRRTLSPGRRVGLAAAPLLAHSGHAAEASELSPEGPTSPPGGHLLDFALLQLDASVGSQGLGQDGEGGAAAPRGWFHLPTGVHAFDEDETLFILGHPSLPGDPQRTLKLTFAVPSKAKLLGSGLRVRYGVNTEGGNSGSPVLDVDFEPVALHHAGKQGEFNQAVPLDLIVAQLGVQVTDPVKRAALGLL